MSAVIEFPVGRIGKGTTGEGATPAEIIIFPGVRIERPGFSLADRLPLSRNRLATAARAKELEGP